MHCRHVEWLRDTAMNFLQLRGFLTFLHDGTLPRRLREEIAKAFVFSFVRCYVDVAGIELNEVAAPVFSSIQEVQDEFIRLCNVYMGSVYLNANWDKAQTIVGITACFDELLLICSEGFRPVAKRALVPEEQVFRMADWYGQDSP